MKKIRLIIGCLVAILLFAANSFASNASTTTKATATFTNGKNLHFPDIAPPAATVNVNNNVNCPTGWTRTNDANNQCLVTATISTSAPPAATMNDAAANANKNERNISGSNDNDQGTTAKAPPVPVSVNSGGTVTAMAPKDDGTYEIVWSCVSNTNNVAAGFINNAEFNIRS